MKKKSIWAFALIAMLTCLGRPAVASDGAFDPVEFVNPLMGTQSSFELSTGNTYPAIARPWGMNFGPRKPVRWGMDGGIPIPPIRYVALNKPISQVLDQ